MYWDPRMLQDGTAIQTNQILLRGGGGAVGVWYLHDVRTVRHLSYAAHDPLPTMPTRRNRKGKSLSRQQVSRSSWKPPGNRHFREARSKLQVHHWKLEERRHNADAF